MKFQIKNDLPPIEKVPESSVKITLKVILVILISASFIISGYFLFMSYNPNLRLGIVGAIDTVAATRYDTTSRTLAANLTRDCLDDKRCSFSKIRDYISTFNYSNDGGGGNRLYPIEQIVQDHSGDCENLAFLAASLYSEVGGIIVVQCVTCHCWNVVELNNKLYVYDATTDLFVSYSPTITDYYKRRCNLNEYYERSS